MLIILFACSPVGPGPDPVTTDKTDPSTPVRWAVGPPTLTPAAVSPDERLHCAIDVPPGTQASFDWTLTGAEEVRVGTTVHPGDTLAQGQLGFGQTATCTVAVSDGHTTLYVRASVRVPEALRTNVLLIIADDVGVDRLAAYGPPDAVRPVTPHLDQLAADGVRFTQAYSYPSCTAARASLLTGRFGRRTGAGATGPAPESAWELPIQEHGLPAVLAGAGVTSVAVGKWHLADALSPSWSLHPLNMGFLHHDGSSGNLGDYFHYAKWVDGRTKIVDRYATIDTVQQAADAVQVLPEPFFVWVALNAPHTPLHVPPEALHTTPATLEGGESSEIYGAMLESVDWAVGSLLAALPAERAGRTTVIFVGDNGTPDHAVVPPYDPSRAKLTLFDGGTHVPLLVAGPPVVEPGIHEGFVHTVDVFSTIAELSGVRATEIPVPVDGHSLVPFLRAPTLPGRQETVFTEAFWPNGPPPYARDEVAIRDQHYKLIRDRRSGRDALFAYVPDAVDEGPPLAPGPATSEAYARLSLALEAQLAAMPYAW